MYLLEFGENLRRTKPLEWVCEWPALLQPKHRRELWSRVRLPLCIPPFAWSLLRGQSGARRHCAALLRLCRPSGHGSSLEGTLQESATWRLGAGPTRLASPGVTQARSGNSTNGDTSCIRTKLLSSASSAATQKFAPTTTAASPRSHWQPSRPTRKRANTSRTRSGTVASSSESSLSSPAP